MGFYDVESGKYAKLGKACVVENGKYVKLPKAYIVENGKYVKVWSGSEFKLIGFGNSSGSGAYAQLFSEDGKEWGVSESNVIYPLNSVINVNGVLYGINETYYTGNQYMWYLYKSTDNGVTWTQVANMTGYNGKYILRYLNGYLVVIGRYNKSYTSLNSLWYSTNMGSSWTATNYKVSETSPSGATVSLENNSIPLDFRYGAVGGVSGYYLLMQNFNKYNSYVYRFSSFPTTAAYTGQFICGSGYNSFGLWDKGALSIRAGILSIVGCNTTSSSPYTYCYKVADTTKSPTQAKVFTNCELGTVASNSSYMVGTCGTTSFKFDGNTVTEGGSIGNQTASYAYIGASSFVNGSRVVSYKSYSSQGYIMYSDDYGATWTIVNASALGTVCRAICSITDSYY